MSGRKCMIIVPPDVLESELKNRTPRTPRRGADGLTDDERAAKNLSPGQLEDRPYILANWIGTRKDGKN